MTKTYAVQRVGSDVAQVAGRLVTSLAVESQRNSQERLSIQYLVAQNGSPDGRSTVMILVTIVVSLIFLLEA
jgi:hypothetical protein